MSKKIWTAIIGAIATLGTGYWQYKPHTPDAVADKVALSGVVRDTDGHSIRGAKVSVTQDRDTPEVIYTDSDGIFHVEIKPKLHSLRIGVEAQAYNPVTKEENSERTGLIEITLEKSAVAKDGTDNGVRRSRRSVASGVGSTAVMGTGNSTTTQIGR